MRRMAWMASTSVVFVLFAFVFETVSLAADELIARFTSEPPKVDGDLSDPAWAAAKPVESFTLAQSATAVPKKTSVRAVFDGQRLYVGIECAEPRMGKIKAQTRKRDGNAWEDDCIEIFLRPERNAAEYAQLVFNTLGSCDDYRFGIQGKPADWNPTWEVKVAKGAQGWQAEACISFKELGAGAAMRGDTWGLKVGREDRTQFDQSGGRTAMFYTWPPGAAYGGPTGYGELVFEDRNCIRNADFTRRAVGRYEDWEITKGDEDRFETVATDGLATLRFRVPGEKNAWICQGLRVQANASYRLSAEVKGEANGYLQIRPEQGPGREAPRLSTAISRSDSFRTVEMDFPSGPAGRAGFTIGNSSEGAREGSILLRRLRVERVTRDTLPEYMTWRREEPDPIHGLKSFMERHGIKPYERLRELGLGGCERLAFRDTVTGTEIWKLTNDSVPEGHHYALWTPYSANGAHLWLSSRRWVDGGTQATYFVMDSNGDGVRLLVPWYNLGGWWHPRDGDVYLYIMQMKDHYEVTAINVRTMEKTVLAKLPPKNGVQMAEPGPWSDWLLIVYPDGLTGELIKMDGSARNEIKFPVEVGETHFSRAHKDVFYSFFHGRTGKGNVPVAMRITADGKLDPDFFIANTQEDATYRNMRRGGHGQSSPDETMYASADGTVTLADGSSRQIIVPGYLTDYASYIGNNGYVSWRVTPEWMIYNNGPQGLKLWADGSNAQNICFFNTLSTTYESMPWACSSPDGTKLAYRSTMANAVNFYQAVVSNPAPPAGLAAKAGEGGVALAWEAPALHKEIAGYIVYRSEESGRGYRQITPRPVAGTSFTDGTAVKGRTYYYLVSSIEHSGLESGYSSEVCAMPPSDSVWGGQKVRQFYEAEFAVTEQPVTVRRSPPDTSNMHYVSASDYLGQKLQRRGGATFALQAPKEGTYRLLARARVKEGAKGAVADLAVDGKRLGEWKIEGKDWRWRAAPAGFSLSEGRHSLAWVPKDSAFELDRICLTDDDRFVPRGLGLRDETAPPGVAGLKATGDGPFAVALTWEGVNVRDFSHYNVYASREPGFEVSQGTRVGSVYKPGFLDWGLRPGTAYGYRVTAVDRAGNEGPAAKATARTERLETATILVEAESGRASGQALVQEDPAASGEKAVWVPELGTTGKPTYYVPGKAKGALSVEFSVPTDGTYMIWGRFRSVWREAVLTLILDNNRKDSRRWPITFGYYHEKAYMIWGRGATASYIFCWCEARRNTCPDPRPFLFKLQKGRHRLDIEDVGEGLSVDEIAVTNDFSWTPEGVRNYY